MLANRNDSTTLGTFNQGQGSVNAVAGQPTSTLRTRIAIYARGLFLRLGDRIALELKRNAAGMTPWRAMCWASTTACSTRRHQRHQRWLPGVAVDPGTVGVRW